MNIDAEEDTRALVICAHYFAQVIQENCMVECFAYKLASVRFSDAMRAVRRVLFLSVEQRLAYFLLQEISNTGNASVCMTHEKLAKYLCSAREVITRMLRQFADEGIVTLNRGTITVRDKTKLQRLAGKDAMLSASSFKTKNHGD